MNELRNLDWQEICDRLSQLATSEAARDQLRKLGPLPSAEEATRNFRRTEELLAIVASGLRPHMESLDLFQPWYQRLTRNAVLKTLELRDVRHFCVETLALKETLKDCKTTYLSELHGRLMSADEPLSAIDQIVTPGGEIRTDASEKLYQLTGEKSQLARQVQITLDRLVKSFQIEHLLQDKYVTTREGRWVLPIKSGMQHGFEGIVHDASQTKQTVFMEPQDVVPINNRLREIENEIEAEIERLLAELSHYLSNQRFGFEETRKALLEADVQLAQTQLAARLGARPCEFTADVIHLKEVRHPLLALNNPKVIANSVHLNPEQRVLLLSGPNAGGKTVLLKAIGLAAHMARCGLFVCVAEGSKLPFFKKILAAVGDSQSVDANLSTFAAHLKALQSASELSGPDHLLLVDEICGSTDPEEGAALARSFITAFTENGVFGVVTSHLGELKRNWPEDSGVINGSMEFDERVGPTYRFILGVPGQSLAIQTARRVGVKSKIIDQAMKFLSPEVRAYQEQIQEVENLKKDIVRVQDQLVAERREAKAEKEKYQGMVESFNKERDQLLQKEVRNAEKRIDELVQSMKAQDIFRRHGEVQRIKQELPTVVKAEASATGAVGALGNRTATTAEEFAKLNPPGTAVHVVSLGRDGVIQGTPNAREEVPVLSSSMRLMIPWRDLRPHGQVQNPTQKIMRQSGRITASQLEEDRVVDVRGLTVDESLQQIEIQLDTAAVNGEDRVKVIHGHGTDTLKRAIRSALSRSVYVKKWQAGTPETGGDGVTWIEIK